MVIARALLSVQSSPDPCIMATILAVMLALFLKSILSKGTPEQDDQRAYWQGYSKGLFGKNGSEVVGAVLLFLIVAAFVVAIVKTAFRL